MKTTLYFRVRSVFRNGTQTTLTLDPVKWFRDSDTKTIPDDEGGTIPAWEECAPTDHGAEADLPGGKTTELRFDGDRFYEPGEYLTLTVELTDTEDRSGREQQTKESGR